MPKRSKKLKPTAPDLGLNYDGFGKRRPKPKLIPERSGSNARMVPENPTRDLPMTLFWQNIDKEALVLFLSEHDKYLDFVRALHDPTQAHASYNLLCRRYGVTLHELNSVYTDGNRLLGLMLMSTQIPDLMGEVMGDSRNSTQVCPRCDGLKTLTNVERDGEGNITNTTSRDCPVCKGVGDIKQIGDKDARHLVFESMKLTGQKGPLVAIQQNFGNDPSLDSKMESLLKMTQSITLGDKKDDAE